MTSRRSDVLREVHRKFTGVDLRRGPKSRQKHHDHRRRVLACQTVSQYHTVLSRAGISTRRMKRRGGFRTVAAVFCASLALLLGCADSVRERGVGDAGDENAANGGSGAHTTDGSSSDSGARTDAGARGGDKNNGGARDGGAPEGAGGAGGAKKDGGSLSAVDAASESGARDGSAADSSVVVPAEAGLVTDAGDFSCWLCN